MSQSEIRLKQELHTLTLTHVRSDIIQSLWRVGATEPSQLARREWDAYFAYYTRKNTAALVDEGKYLSIRSHVDLLRIAQYIGKGKAIFETREMIRRDLTQRRTMAVEEMMIEGSVRLSARLFAMVNVGTFPSELSAKFSLSWNNGTLSDALEVCLVQSIEGAIQVYQSFHGESSRT